MDLDEVRPVAATKDPLPALEQYIPFGTVEIPTLIKGESSRTTSTGSSRWSHGRLAQVPLVQTHPLYEAIDALNKIYLTHLSCKEPTSGQNGKLRIYLLPQDVDYSRYSAFSQNQRLALRLLMSNVNRSPASWISEQEDQAEERYESPPVVEESLFYIFNTLDSPKPNLNFIKDSWTRELMAKILNDPIAVAGLRTPLYPYQRRSAAVMIQREARPKLILDPALTAFTNPTGQEVYMNKNFTSFLRGKVEYEEARGGILAETMGFGKTLICLTAILATRGHYPEIPPQYQDTSLLLRPTVASLGQMAASIIIRAHLPWRQYFRTLSSQGDDYASCVEMLERNHQSYWRPAAFSYLTTSPNSGTRIYPASITLIIVPDNLISQWRHEIERHMELDCISVYQVDDPKSRLPHESELMSIDILLMTKTSFKKEMSLAFFGSIISEQELNCPCSPIELTRWPVCSKHRNSPLRRLHFLRIIVDEGHQFASSGLHCDFVQSLERIEAERRWIVSGTPSGSQGLIGAEVELAAAPGSSQGVNGPDALLKSIGSPATERKDLDRLGLIVTRFLRVRPWCNAWCHSRTSGNDSASWKASVVSSEKRTVSLRGILSSLIVRHRIQDIEAELPPLHNRAVYLRPSHFDKISINLFVLFLTANAVTSERVDRDYMFERRNRHDVDLLIRNLRHSGFYWTGHEEKDLRETLRVSTEYLRSPFRHPTDADRTRLESALAYGQRALASNAWVALSKQHEMGMFIEHFPPEAAASWALCNASEPLLMSSAQLQLAQKYVDERLYASNPLEGLAAAASRASDSNMASTSRSKSRRRVLPFSKPTSGMQSNGGTKFLRPTQKLQDSLLPVEDTQVSGKSTPNLPKSLSATIDIDSPIAHTQLCGTASTKLSYLIDQIAKLHKDEKILVFYEADHIAWYIAQALEIINVEHLIYGGGISNSRLSVYLETFNATEKFRVMLMDLRKAAQGLHVAAASRVFFVNPVWQPTIEAQAIKRAHRIGQQRPVYVETLILGDTLEDEMFRRRTAMTSQEHYQASKSLLDDQRMSDLIMNLSLIEHLDDDSEMAPLEQKQQIFARGAKALTEVHPDDGLVISMQAREESRSANEYMASMAGLPKPQSAFPASDISPAPSADMQMQSDHLDTEAMVCCHNDDILAQVPSNWNPVPKVVFATSSPSLPAETGSYDPRAVRKKRKVLFDLPSEG